VNQEESEHNEVDGMKKGVDSTGKVMHVLYPVRQSVPASDFLEIGKL